ncbi:MAG: hypothetical protein PHP45_03150 [Elusimicrobiales bacterium]|nr:hypothetical protein [Elusimicrobiales bacterium]
MKTRFAHIMRSRRASAFVLAMAFIIVSLAAIAVFQTHIRESIMVHAKRSVLPDAGPVQSGLAGAVALLETGEPSPGYTCRYGAQPVALIFSSQTSLNWEVASSTEDYRVAEATCTCPSVFYSTSTAHLWNRCP